MACSAACRTANTSAAPTVVWYGPFVDYQQELAARIRAWTNRTSTAMPKKTASASATIMRRAIIACLVLLPLTDECRNGGIDGGITRRRALAAAARGRHSSADPDRAEHLVEPLDLGDQRVREWLAACAGASFVPRPGLELKAMALVAGDGAARLRFRTLSGDCHVVGAKREERHHVRTDGSTHWQTRVEFYFKVGQWWWRETPPPACS